MQLEWHRCLTADCAWRCCSCFLIPGHLHAAVRACSIRFVSPVSSTQKPMYRTGIKLVAVQYGRLLLAPQSRDVGKAAAVVRSSQRRQADVAGAVFIAQPTLTSRGCRSRTACFHFCDVHAAGQLVVRCASGTFWFDGWSLDSRSNRLVVEFQDEQTQRSARDLAVCLADEGGEQVSDSMHPCESAHIAASLRWKSRWHSCSGGGFPHLHIPRDGPWYPGKQLDCIQKLMLLQATRPQTQAG